VKSLFEASNSDVDFTFEFQSYDSIIYLTHDFFQYEILINKQMKNIKDKFENKQVNSNHRKKEIRNFLSKCINIKAIDRDIVSKQISDNTVDDINKRISFNSTGLSDCSVFENGKIKSRNIELFASLSETIKSFIPNSKILYKIDLNNEKMVINLIMVDY
jgi:serine/threonine protein kinase